MSALNPPTLSPLQKSSLPQTIEPPVVVPSPLLERSEPAPGVVGTAGMIAFLAGATVLFAAVLVAYAIVRTQVAIAMPALPWAFWLSTFVILLSSLFLQYAYTSARLRHGTAAHRALLTSTGLTYLFVGLQAPGLIMLAQLSFAFRAVSTTLFVLTLIMIGLHLIHVVGGMAALSVFALRSEKHKYEGEEIGQIRPITIYHHYLAVVWVIMFCLLLVLN